MTSLTPPNELIPHVAVASRHESVSAAWATRTFSSTWPLVAVSLLACVGSMGLRWQRADTLPLQCDEIPLLIRFTSLGAVAATESQARAYEPSLFSMRTGAARSLRVPNYHFTVHTTTGFWGNLALNLFGYSPAVVRGMSIAWSLVAMVAVAWAAWLVFGSLSAACVAACILAFSPFGLAYGAQLRGYAEALALTPVLLIALEYFRRRPESRLRAALVFLCAFQLSLTVYTMWVYWVLPIMVVAVILLPRNIADESRRRSARTAIGLIVLGLVCVMAVYTLDRFTQLVTTAAIASGTGPAWGGANLARWDELLVFAGSLGRRLFVQPVLIPVLAVVGIFVLVRSRLRWWAWMFLAGVAAPIGFALLSGSPGYVRNLSYLLGPAAILAALAVDRGLTELARRYRPVFVYGVFSLALLTAAAASAAELDRRADAILLPDWGGAVKALDGETPAAIPRWFCPCLANHWQINWYRDRTHDDDLLSVPVGGRIEVVMGARHERDGLAIVYRSDPDSRAVREQPLPPYIARSVPAELHRGVELRRWVGTRSDPSDHPTVADGSPVFLLATGTETPTAAQWSSFLSESGADEHGAVTFKPAVVAGRRIETLIAPAHAVRGIIAGLQEHLRIDPLDVRLFTLAPFSCDDPRPPVAEAAP